MIFVRKPACECRLLNTYAIEHSGHGGQPTGESANAAKTKGDTEQQAKVTEICRMSDGAVDARGNQPMLGGRLYYVGSNA